MRLRFIHTAPATGTYNMGVDEAILNAVSRGNASPTLRFFSWSPPAVTIGYFQSLSAEVDVAACQKDGVHCVRRLTGGGAVFHDVELTYSLILPLESSIVPQDILESYRVVCQGIIVALGALGLQAVFAPINDIHVGGRKISGNAQTRRKGCFLQHGTLLLQLDTVRMFHYLKVPQEKNKGRLLAEIAARVCSLEEVLGRGIPYSEVASCLKSGFAQALCAELIEGKLSLEEESEAKKLAEERFSSDSWNRRRDSINL